MDMWIYRKLQITWQTSMTDSIYRIVTAENIYHAIQYLKSNKSDGNKGLTDEW